MAAHWSSQLSKYMYSFCLSVVYCSAGDAAQRHLAPGGAALARPAADRCQDVALVRPVAGRSRVERVQPLQVDKGRCQWFTWCRRGSGVLPRALRGVSPWLWPVCIRRTFHPCPHGRLSAPAMSEKSPCQTMITNTWVPNYLHTWVTSPPTTPIVTAS